MKSKSGRSGSFLPVNIHGSHVSVVFCQFSYRHREICIPNRVLFFSLTIFLNFHLYEKCFFLSQGSQYDSNLFHNIELKIQSHAKCKECLFRAAGSGLLGLQIIVFLNLTLNVCWTTEGNLDARTLCFWTLCRQI